MDNKTIILDILTLLVLSTGVVYVTFSDNARLRVDNDKTTFYVPHADYSWIWSVSGREYNGIFDGTSKMNRDVSEIKVEEFVDGDIITIKRTTPYIRGPIIIDTYTFDNTLTNIESFPYTHQVEVVNGKGYFYRYEVRDLDYDGETYKLVDETELSFGKNMKVTLMPDYRWAWVYKTGLVKSQYDINSDYETFTGLRLFDPWSSNLNTNLTAYYNFNETAGSNIPNVVDGLFNFTNYNMSDSNWGSGKLNNAINFNLSEDEFSLAGDMKLFNNHSYSFWVYPKDSPPSGTKVMSKANASGSSVDFIIQSGPTIMARPLQSDLSALNFDQVNIQLKTWTHIVIVENTTHYCFYVNGSLKQCLGFDGTYFLNDENLSLGARVKSNFVTDDWFNGSLDELGMWNRTLTTAEIAELWNDGDGITFGDYGINMNYTVGLPSGVVRYLNCSPDWEHYPTIPYEQDAIYSAINATNNGSLVNNFNIKYVGGINTGWKLFACNASGIGDPQADVNCINLTQSYQTIWESVDIDETKQIWLYGNCSYVSSNPGVTISMNASA